MVFYRQSVKGGTVVSCYVFWLFYASAAMALHRRFHGVQDDLLSQTTKKKQKKSKGVDPATCTKKVAVKVKIAT